MIEQFFGSKTRVELLQFFFNNTNRHFYVRELVRRTGMQLNSIRRELENLAKFGILMEDKDYKETNNLLTKDKKFNLPIKKKYYKLNKNFVLYKEIEILILKSKLLLEKRLIEKVQEIGDIKYLLLTGVFTGVKNSLVDILIVGDVDKIKIKELISKFSGYINREINYTLLTKEDYKYRWTIKDKFLFNILENENIVVLDKIGGQQNKK